MAGKARVHELANELGISSKQVLSKLQDLGEYVKSPSSTVEAPVARRLRESVSGGDSGGASRPRPTTIGPWQRRSRQRLGCSMPAASRHQGRSPE